MRDLAPDRALTEDVGLDLLELLPAAALLVGRNGELLGGNARGRVLRQAASLLRLECGRVRAVLAREVAAFARALAAAEPGLRLSTTTGEDALVAIRAVGERGQLRALVVTGRAHAAAPDWRLVQSCFELTPAECRAAMMLASGHSITQIAGACGLAPSTVKSQARLVYMKAGVGRQIKLICLLGTFPPGPGGASVDVQALCPPGGG